MFVCEALHDLVPFVQFKKREKHPWRSVTFSKVEYHSSMSVLHVFNRTNCAKSCKASHMIKNDYVTYVIMLTISYRRFDLVLGMA